MSNLLPENNHNSRYSYLEPTVATVSATQDGDKILAYMARVSNPSASIDTPPERLIGYLIEKKHWSPFEMVNLTVKVDVTRDIARQMLRHGMRPQEFSQRYQDVNKLENSFVLRECRLQHPENRQMSIEPDLDIVENKELSKWWHDAQTEIINLVSEKYKEALKKGVAKEQARAILPEGNTMSKLYFNGNIRNWIHFCEVRKDRETTQKEHCVVADQIWDHVKSSFPITALAVEEYYFNQKEDVV
jgi:thymidylate synthase (FAD)